MIMAHIGEVRILIWFESKAILRLPKIVLAPFKYQVLAFVNQPINVDVLHLLDSGIQEQRLAKRIAKAYIGEPSLFQLNKQGHVIERWIEASLRARHSR